MSGLIDRLAALLRGASPPAVADPPGFETPAPLPVPPPPPVPWESRPQGFTQPPERSAKFLSHISPESQDGLEIGPLCWPIVRKIDCGNRIRYIDFATADELREKYRGHAVVQAHEIVDVDFIWGERTLTQLVGENRFDYVIASHVIEHVPDMIGWLIEISSVLRDKGILSLCIPDKRHTFDYFKPTSSPGQVIENYLLKARRPGPRAVFDHFALGGKIDIAASWAGPIDKSSFAANKSVTEAFVMAKEVVETNKYQDVHVTIMTPSSFLDLLEVVARLQLLDFRIVEFFDTEKNKNEFFASLERSPRGQKGQEMFDQQLASIALARQRIV
jgi:SAM-dependent methyltransferase